MDSMTRIADTIMKEKERNLQRQKQCENELAELPKGSLYTTKRNSQEYLLRVYIDDDKKKVHKYIGNISKDKTILPAIQAELEKRKLLEQELKNLKKVLEAMEKMFKIADKLTQEKSVRENLIEVNANKYTNSSDIAEVLNKGEIIISNSDR